jgi:outer membrane protein with beta-barrel domain
MRLPTLALMVLAPAAALAEPAESITKSAPAPTYELGLRIGGYGFHREGDSRPGEGWSECRMNGLGVFGGRTLTGPLFIEAGLDMYSTANGPIGPEPTDLAVDRTSGLLSTAIGARTNVASWLRGYIQLGAGIELTKVSVAYGEERIRDSKVMPEGFFGAGIDLKLWRGTYVGATFRTLLMGNFDYDPDRLDMSKGWVSAPPASEVFDASVDVAAQGQFYVRHDL